jgi:hypothetical protein
MANKTLKVSHKKTWPTKFSIFDVKMSWPTKHLWLDVKKNPSQLNVQDFM